MTLGLGTRRICAAKTTPTRSATHRASPENFLRSESCPEAVSRLFPLPCPPSAAHIHTHKPSAHLTFLSRADGSSVQPADMGRFITILPVRGRGRPASLFGFYQSSSKCSGIIMPLGNRIVVSPPESISGTSSWPEAAGRARKTTMQDFVRATTRVPTI